LDNILKYMLKQCLHHYITMIRLDMQYRMILINKILAYTLFLHY